MQLRHRMCYACATQYPRVSEVTLTISPALSIMPRYLRRRHTFNASTMDRKQLSTVGAQQLAFHLEYLAQHERSTVEADPRAALEMVLQAAPIYSAIRRDGIGSIALPHDLRRRDTITLATYAYQYLSTTVALLALFHNGSHHTVMCRTCGHLASSLGIVAACNPALFVWDRLDFIRSKQTSTYYAAHKVRAVMPESEGPAVWLNMCVTCDALGRYPADDLRQAQIDGTAHALADR